ncbi:MAG: DEAD/DEAH box helicase family protein [Clostridia bacterium]|nr:DEAD/DEAH box helicase family protein [Clostridia bacterium]
MTRKEVIEAISRTKPEQLLLELPTGFGKTKIAIDYVVNTLKCKHILVVCPTHTIIDNWKDELDKWNIDKDLFSFITYVSFNKPEKFIDKNYDCYIYDECHHLSTNNQAIILKYNKQLPKYQVLLSATIDYNKRKELKICFPQLKTYKESLKTVIAAGEVSNPICALVKLQLPKDKLEEYNRIQGEIAKYTRLYNTKKQAYAQNMLLKAKGDMLKYLADCKTDFVKKILWTYSNYRTLTFCKDIKHTEQLGKHPINSKNTESDKSLQMFNEGKIKHITACSILDEGVSLYKCQIGIFAYLNSNSRILLQRVGRILRHSKPIIYIPYYEGTREEEIVNKILSLYFMEDKIKRFTEEGFLKKANEKKFGKSSTNRK